MCSVVVSSKARSRPLPIRTSPGFLSTRLDLQTSLWGLGDNDDVQVTVPQRVRKAMLSLIARQSYVF